VLARRRLHRWRLHRWKRRLRRRCGGRRSRGCHRFVGLRYSPGLRWRGCWCSLRLRRLLRRRKDGTRRCGAWRRL
jgi:hypothetical protein